MIYICFFFLFTGVSRSPDLFFVKWFKILDFLLGVIILFCTIIYEAISGGNDYKRILDGVFEIFRMIKMQCKYYRWSWSIIIVYSGISQKQTEKVVTNAMLNGAHSAVWKMPISI